MHTHSTFNSPSRQKGLALVILIVVIALAYISYFVSGLSVPDIKYKQDVKTMAALKKAKQALLAYAMNYPDTAAGMGNLTQGPGNLPCPDDDFDGDSDNPGAVLPGCTSDNLGTMGRFPWAEIGIGELRDGSGELLWYAVSNTFVNAAGENVNTSTTGRITIRNADGVIQSDGTNINGVVAVIISPGETLVRGDALVQSRTTAAERNDPQNYLDIAFGEDNADFINNNTDGFIRGVVRNAANDIIVNDIMMVITYNEIMELVHARVASELINVLNTYKGACTVYPDASEYDDANYDPEETVPVVPDYNSDGFQSGHIPDVITVAPPRDDWGTGCAAGATLPTWFDAEGWHENMYYQFVTTPCTPGTDCIELDDDGIPPALRNDVEAIIMFAGRELAIQDRTTYSVDRSEYYEGVNTSDNAFDVSQPDDSIWVVAP